MSWFQADPNSLLMQRIETNGRIGRHATAWLTLVWSVWIFLTPLSVPRTFPNWMWPTLTSYAVFLVLYYCAYYRDRRYVPWCVFGFAALSYLVTPFNAGAHGYLIYACAFMTFCTTPRRAVAGMVTLMALHALEWTVLGWPPVYLVGGILVGLAVGMMNIAMVRRMQAQAALRLSHDEVRRLASLAERERIGRDLHDLLGHTLSLVALKSELACKLIDRDPQAARRELAEVTRVAREALSQVRSAVTGIRAAGLAAELASARLLLESDGVAFDYELAPVVLPPVVETVLSMTLREAVTNVQRHARALHVQVRLRVEGDDVVVSVQDDGRAGPIAPGNGLSGMRERIEAEGGRLRIDSAPGRGTCVQAVLPLRAEDAPAPLASQPLPSAAA